MGGNFPDDDALLLVGASKPETNDEWAIARRQASFEILARVAGIPTVNNNAFTYDAGGNVIYDAHSSCGNRKSGAWRGLGAG